MTETQDLRRQMHKEHLELRVLQEDLVTGFEAYCEDPLPAHAKRFDEALQNFSASLERHFEFEEDGGYMNFVVDRRPHHNAEVEMLRKEHGEIREGIAKLQKDVSQDLTSDDELMRQFKKDFVDLIRLFGRHEQAERELIMDVYWLEGGYAS
jgi:hemerythrin-like domain-containing protein